MLGPSCGALCGFDPPQLPAAEAREAVAVANATARSWQPRARSAAKSHNRFAIPLTFSIADGIGLGFLTYVLIKVMVGRRDECSPMLTAVALFFALKFAWL